MNDKSKEMTGLLVQAVKASGFPFQARIQNIIESVDGWHVTGSEVSWSHEGREEFIDIVAQKRQLLITVECKRFGVLSEDQRSHKFEWRAGYPKRSFVFLCRKADEISDTETQDTHITCYIGENDISEYFETPGARGQIRKINPASYEASLCVTVDVNEPKELIERDVARLARGTHEYARTMYGLLAEVNNDIAEEFLPIYVTTAPLYVVRFDPTSVSEADGNIDIEEKSLVRVPWVRFTKAFMASGTVNSDIRTVIVVEAIHLNEFLEKFEVVGAPDTSSLGSELV